jgi:hypothetical protein
LLQVEDLDSDVDEEELYIGELETEVRKKDGKLETK